MVGIIVEIVHLIDCLGCMCDCFRRFYLVGGACVWRFDLVRFCRVL